MLALFQAFVLHLVMRSLRCKRNLPFMILIPSTIESSSIEFRSREFKTPDSRTFRHPSFYRMLCPIEEHWLPVLAPKHCVLTEPLDNPPPEYSPSQDCLLVWQSGTYGPLAWELSKTHLRAPTHWKDRFNWFAKSLLEGQVFPSYHEILPEALARR